MTQESISLTKRISLEDGVFYFNYLRPKGLRRPLGPLCPPLARMLDRYHPGAMDAFREHERKKLVRKQNRMYGAVRIRAAKASLPMMSVDEFRELWERAADRCELTGIPFSFDRHNTCAKRPWAPSVDRIDNSRGYEFDNCRMVCTAVNLALNEFGDDVLMKIAIALADRHKPPEPRDEWDTQFS